MTLPIPVDYPPMEAKLVAELPEGEGWQYEPKWDGFRCLAFKDGDDDRAALEIRASRSSAISPRSSAALKSLACPRCVLDGELVVPEGEALSFDELLMRIHPAESRIRKLSREHPALYVVFDLLVDERGTSLVEQPLAARREALGALRGARFRGQRRRSGSRR